MLCLCLTPLAVIAADNRFSVAGSVAEISGPGANAPNELSRKIDDISDGLEERLLGAWEVSPEWTLTAELGKATVRYESPLVRDCPLVAGILLGYEFCQLLLSPRTGTLEDRLHWAALGIARRQELTSKLALTARIGYQWKRSTSDGDAEAATLSSCETSDFPQPIPNCRPVASDRRFDGLTASVSASYRLSQSWSAELGANWEQQRTRIYRNGAAVEFCATNVQSQFGGFCNSLDEFLPHSAFESDDWYWWHAGLMMQPAKAGWIATLRYEARGSRDWRVVQAGVGYVWD